MKQIHILTAFVLTLCTQSFGMHLTYPGATGLQNKLILRNGIDEIVKVELFKRSAGVTRADIDTTPMVVYNAPDSRVKHPIERYIGRGGDFVIPNFQSDEFIKVNGKDVPVNFSTLFNNTCTIRISIGGAGSLFGRGSLTFQPAGCNVINPEIALETATEQFEKLKRTETEEANLRETNAIKKALGIHGELDNLSILGLEKGALGLNTAANLELIKKKFRDLTRYWHPDKARARGIDPEFASQVVKRIIDAYKELGGTEEEVEELMSEFVPIGRSSAKK